MLGRHKQINDEVIKLRDKHVTSSIMSESLLNEHVKLLKTYEDELIIILSRPRSDNEETKSIRVIIEEEIPKTREILENAFKENSTTDYTYVYNSSSIKEWTTQLTKDFEAKLTEINGRITIINNTVNNIDADASKQKIITLLDDLEVEMGNLIQYRNFKKNNYEEVKNLHHNKNESFFLYFEVAKERLDKKIKFIQNNYQKNNIEETIFKIRIININNEYNRLNKDSATAVNSVFIKINSLTNINSQMPAPLLGELEKKELEKKTAALQPLFFKILSARRLNFGSSYGPTNIKLLLELNALLNCSGNILTNILQSSNLTEDERRKISLILNRAISELRYSEQTAQEKKSKEWRDFDNTKQDVRAIICDAIENFKEIGLKVNLTEEENNEVISNVKIKAINTEYSTLVKKQNYTSLEINDTFTKINSFIDNNTEELNLNKGHLLKELNVKKLDLQSRIRAMFVINSTKYPGTNSRQAILLLADLNKIFKLEGNILNSLAKKTSDADNDNKNIDDLITQAFRELQQSPTKDEEDISTLEYAIHYFTGIGLTIDVDNIQNQLNNERASLYAAQQPPSMMPRAQVFQPLETQSKKENLTTDNYSEEEDNPLPLNSKGEFLDQLLEINQNAADSDNINLLSATYVLNFLKEINDFDWLSSDPNSNVLVNLDKDADVDKEILWQILILVQNAIRELNRNINKNINNPKNAIDIDAAKKTINTAIGHFTSIGIEINVLKTDQDLEITSTPQSAPLILPTGDNLGNVPGKSSGVHTPPVASKGTVTEEEEEEQTPSFWSKYGKVIIGVTTAASIIGLAGGAVLGGVTGLSLGGGIVSIPAGIAGSFLLAGVGMLACGIVGGLLITTMCAIDHAIDHFSGNHKSEPSEGIQNIGQGAENIVGRARAAKKRIDLKEGLGITVKDTAEHTNTLSFPPQPDTPDFLHKHKQNSQLQISPPPSSPSTPRKGRSRDGNDS